MSGGKSTLGIDVDLASINQMSRTTLAAAQKLVDPPMMMPDDGFLTPLRRADGGLNYRRRLPARLWPLERRFAWLLLRWRRFTAWAFSMEKNHGA